MQLIVVVLSVFLVTVRDSRVDAARLSQLEQSVFESRVRNASTILFGRFNWAMPISPTDNIDLVHSMQQNTFEFTVYCTIKKSQGLDNVSRFLRVMIKKNGKRRRFSEHSHRTIVCLETEMDMRKNRWFILFPKMTVQRNTWLIDDRSAAFDLEDDLELHLFEQLCFLKPKLPIGKIRSLSFIESKKTCPGFPAHGLLDRCPKPSPEHCLKNGT